ncbi:MAG TPA: flagellar filament capping protein FliD [Polyangiaceae bacterium]|nr:flagellar filament capping protein FliD [Polyangiaceae bacterium]
MSGTGTITFGGVGSGIDTESIVTGLVNASSTNLNAMKSRATDARAAVSAISNLSSLLATLKSATSALSDVRDARAFSASVTGDGVVATANGAASPGSYDVDVLALAKEFRGYSDTQASSTDALNQTGTLSLKIGTADPLNIDVTGTDSLQTIADKINAAGVRANASVFYDGSAYRLQVRGLDTGKANDITLTETGTTLGLANPDNVYQHAQDSKVKIDGYTVTRSSNQIVGALPGVTLAVTKETTSSANVTVASDPNALAKKLQAVVDAYNQVVGKVHTVAGFGTTAGTVTELKGDTTLRSLTSRMSDAVLQTVSGAGTFQTLSSIGLSLNRDGTLSLDQTKLSDAVQKDSSGVSALLGGVGTGKGVMDVMTDLMDTFTKGSSGVLSVEKDQFDARAKSLDDSAAREQSRLDAYADQLRKQFTQMDSLVSGTNTDLSYLTKFFGS